MRGAAMRHLIAVDPSIVSAGVAYFYLGVLQKVWTVIPKDTGTPDNTGARIRDIGSEIVRVVEPQLYLVRDLVHLITEWPEIYREKPGRRNDRNDLPGLAGVGSWVAGKLDCSFETVLPKEWCAQIPKSTLVSKRFDNTRSRRIADRLDPEELAVYRTASTHDGIDAIGIGLHSLNRGIIDRRRVFYGAT